MGLGEVVLESSSAEDAVSLCHILESILFPGCWGVPVLLSVQMESPESPSILILRTESPSHGLAPLPKSYHQGHLHPKCKQCVNSGYLHFRGKVTLEGPRGPNLLEGQSGLMLRDEALVSGRLQGNLL